MRITYITAGAGGMYCGSCIRDNALATSLRALGHEVTLVPTYTPPLTDEPNVSEHRVFFGGISVYLEQYVSLFRKTPWLLDRLWESPWLLKLVSGRGIKTSPKLLGELTVSMLEGEDGHQKKEILKLLHWLRSQPRPDVVDLTNSLFIAMARPIQETLDVPVCCTLQGENVFMEGLEEPYRARALELVRRNVEHVDAFLAVSDYYAELMGRYLHIPDAKLHVVPLGINTASLAIAGDGNRRPFTIGFFGRVAPEKGLHLLCEAYRRLRQAGDLPEARVRIGGYLAPEHEEYLRSNLERMREWGLGGEVEYRGVLNLEEKIEFLQSLDVFAVPATYDDPKGLPLLEAMACGVPVVQPERGTYSELVRGTGGGLLVPAEDEGELAAALLKLQRDPELRRELGRRGAEGVRARYTADAMARRAAEVYASLAGSNRGVRSA